MLILAGVVGLYGQRQPVFRRPIILPPEIVAATITVTGIGGTSAILSVSDLSKLPQQTVKVTDHGTRPCLKASC
jgi:hypothetical protein